MSLVLNRVEKEEVLREYDRVDPETGVISRIQRVEISSYEMYEDTITRTVSDCMITCNGRDLYRAWLTCEECIDLIRANNPHDYYIIGETKTEVVGTKEEQFFLGRRVVERDITEAYNAKCGVSVRKTTPTDRKLTDEEIATLFADAIYASEDDDFWL